MKYQNLKSFHKHLSSASDHLCPVYLIAIADDFERIKTLNAILSYLVTVPSRFSGADCSLRDLFEAMQSRSLLGDSLVVLDEVEKLPKKALQTLSENLHLSSGYVLLGARSKTPLAAIVEKEGVILDLLDEKPWDKEKRLGEQLADRAKNAGKRLAADGAHLLFERLGTDVALLENEIDKLICYVGDNATIDREDILQLVSASRTATFWQTAENVIWEGGEFPSLDSTAFHGLIPALRNQLHLGLSLSTLIEEKYLADQWNHYLPKLWPKILEKRSSQAARFGSSYFRKGLDKLFEIELLSRTHSNQHRALLDLFRAYIHAR